MVIMKKQLYALDEVNLLINSGRKLVITADENLLDKLDKGDWIAGTIPYFMTNDGGILTKNKLFVDDLTDLGLEFKFLQYTAQNIDSITINNFENGFVILILPLGSEIHKQFSLNSLNYTDILKNPLLGYVSGFDLNEKNNPTAFVYFGKNKEKTGINGVALHVKLPENEVARVEIINPNSIDEKSPEFTFPITSFEQSECKINGKEGNIADYLISINHPIMLPLISSTNGTLINRDIQLINKEERKVSFFSPVYNDEKYRLAKETDDFTLLFKDKLQINKDDTKYSCLCVSFYMLGNLENKTININGAFTFGEIAYQLLNQTAVFLLIDKI